MQKKGIGNSHAKIILMGEHSVVYGQPAIALPLANITTKVMITANDNHQQLVKSRYFNGLLTNLPEKMNGISELINKLMNHFDGHQDGWTMEIVSDIPAERGMGSSAACAVAIIRAMFDYYDEPIDRKALLKWADVEEKITHRSPSGLDAATVSSNKPVWFKKGAKGTPIKLDLDATMVIADTGIKGATREAINTVKEKLLRQPEMTNTLLNQLGRLTEESRIAVSNNQAVVLGKKLTAAHHALDQLGVSDLKLNQLVKVAIAHHALGAKLTGGGRGGCMFAITQSALGARKIASILKEHGATATWIQPFNKGDIS
ncbi:mevalonate kinase [uncultured Limosilactobacillus sp.]|uniref:mevalonate kinase n=1 Tax=uncultured Limosilactobacillus sp. TaxID=2837629 RepID=UPI0025DDEDFB|nr:mevalonate kinase [uncultured Limosilactobacillus sp.]